MNRHDEIVASALRRIAYTLRYRLADTDVTEIRGDEYAINAYNAIKQQRWRLMYDHDGSLSYLGSWWVADIVDGFTHLWMTGLPLGYTGFARKLGIVLPEPMDSVRMRELRRTTTFRCTDQGVTYNFILYTDDTIRRRVLAEFPDGYPV